MCRQERKADLFLADTSQRGCKVPAQATEGSAQTEERGKRKQEGGSGGGGCRLVEDD